MNQNERKTVMRRMVLLIAVAALVMGLYALRLIFLQLVNDDEYKSRATNTTDYNFTVTAARGDIVDSTGKRIATTTTSYNVVLNKLQMGDEDLDSLLQRLVELFEKNGESWTDTLLISQPDAAGNYTFTARDDSSSDQRQLTTMPCSLQRSSGMLLTPAPARAMASRLSLKVVFSRSALRTRMPSGASASTATSNRFLFSLARPTGLMAFKVLMVYIS